MFLNTGSAFSRTSSGTSGSGEGGGGGEGEEGRGGIGVKNWEIGEEVEGFDWDGVEVGGETFHRLEEGFISHLFAGTFFLPSMVSRE